MDQGIPAARANIRYVDVVAFHEPLYKLLSGNTHQQPASSTQGTTRYYTSYLYHQQDRHGSMSKVRSEQCELLVYV